MNNVLITVLYGAEPKHPENACSKRAASRRSYEAAWQGSLVKPFLASAFKKLQISLDILFIVREHCPVDTFSTRDAARKLGIAVSTLSHYMAVGKVPAPEAVTSGGMTLHLWTEAEIEKVRTLLPKLKNGRKKPRRKQESSQPKSSQQKKK